MNGLKYILFITNTSIKEASQLLHVSSQFITACTNGIKNLPDKHAKTLQEHFHIPALYFTKNLTLKEKMNVDLLLQEKEVGISVMTDFFHEYVEENIRLKQHIQQMKGEKDKNAN